MLDFKYHEPRSLPADWGMNQADTKMATAPQVWSMDDDGIGGWKASTRGRSRFAGERRKGR